MTIKLACALTLAAVTGAVALGCASEPDPNADAPESTLDALDAQDEGFSWNGWSHWPDGTLDTFTYQAVVKNTFTRSYGDATRGGGVCLVHETNNACSTDSACTTLAKNTYGSLAFGYCRNSKCYFRPGSQSANCRLGQSNGHNGVAELRLDIADMSKRWYAYGCMTKAAGPSTDCGSTNPSLYMQSLRSLLTIDSNPCSPSSGSYCD